MYPEQIKHRFPVFACTIIDLVRASAPEKLARLEADAPLRAAVLAIKRQEGQVKPMPIILDGLPVILFQPSFEELQALCRALNARAAARAVLEEMQR